jgi:hypothetical protein
MNRGIGRTTFDNVTRIGGCHDDDQNLSFDKGGPSTLGARAKESENKKKKDSRFIKVSMV